MSSFDTLESSSEQSRPVELFKLVLGSLEFFYTSSDQDWTIDSDTYTRESITRGTLGQGAEDRNRVVDITVPESNVFVKFFFGIPPGDVGSVSIFRLQRDASPLTTILQYKGTVSGVKFPGGGVAQIQTRSVEGTVNKTIPRYNFGGPCQHVLYSDQCGVDPDVQKVTGTVNSVAGNNLDVPITTLFAAQRFAGGFCQLESGGDFRLITASNSGTITLRKPFKTDITGQSLTLWPGCDHTYEGGCKIYSNQRRFGGFPWVPNKNIFTNGLL